MCKKEKCPNFDKCKCNSNNVMTTSPRNLLNIQVEEEVVVDIRTVEWDDTEKVYNFVPDSEVREGLDIVSYISPVGVFDEDEK